MLLLLAALALAEPLSEVVLDDGQILRGQVERQEDGSVIVTLGSGTMLRFPAAAIREVRAVTVAPPAPVATPAPLPSPTPGPATALPLPNDQPGEARTAGGWPRDPNRNRYLYAPSAFTLGSGHGYVSQKELLLTEVAYGITDFWDIQAGTSLITLLIPGAEFGVVGTKLAFPVTDWLRIGAGTQALFAEDMILAAVFGTVTFGTEDKHLSINAGTTFVDFGSFVEPADGAIVIISGNYRLGAKTALIMENWVFVGSGFTPTGDDVWMVPAGAVRLFGPNFATDLGLVPIVVPDSGVPVIPVPWVGFTYNFAMPYAK